MTANFDDELFPNAITKKFWSYVKSFSKTGRIPEKMYLGNCYRNNSKDIAELFNQYFFNQFSDESSYNVDIDFSNDYFSSFSISTNSIYQELIRLNTNKSTGPDESSGTLLKNCALPIAYPLQLLFNLSFKTGSLPAKWELAHIVPIHKKGDKSNIENYRPISLTCIIFKIFEKSIRDALLGSCRDYIHDTQHGFLPQKSCTTQLVPFSHDISLGLNEKKLIDVIYFDFAKAFDSVNHDIILNQLKNEFNVNGLMLKFVKEYLHGRKQRVTINGVLSDECPVVSGVPQGSILGPLLFVLFINDMQDKVSKDTKIALYADDTKIWRYINSPADHQILQNDINALYKWSVENKMKFHANKCKVFSINHFHKNLFSELPFFLFPYHINNTLLDYCDNEKDLGIVISNRFSFNDHHKEILSKAVNQFNLLRRTCHFIKNKQKRKTLYLTLIRSLFEHGSQIWNPNGSTTGCRFENFQKSCIKWILHEQFVPYHEIDYLRKLVDLKILPLEQKFILPDLMIFHKFVFKHIPLELPNEVVHQRSCTRSNTNSSTRFQLVNDITIKNKTFSKSFFVRALSHWNRLPEYCRDICEPAKFRAHIMEHFWSAVKNCINELSHDDVTVDREPD